MLITILSNFSSFNPMMFAMVLAAGAMIFFRRPRTTPVRESTKRAASVTRRVQ
jgi:hypothetical protein